MLHVLNGVQRANRERDSWLKPKLQNEAQLFNCYNANDLIYLNNAKGRFYLAAFEATLFKAQILHLAAV